MSDRTDPRFKAIRRLGGERYAAFLAAGYREWWSSGDGGTPFMLDKKVRRDGARLFTIEVAAYDFSHLSQDRSVVYGPSVHLNSSSGVTFNVEMIDYFQTPDEIERFFLTIFDRMECEPEGD